MGISKKRFGQNFLVDNRKADRIISEAGIKPGDKVLEIGPGRGILTGRILDAGADLTAVEIDRDLIPGLEERFGDDKRLKLLESDIIKVNLSDPGGRDFKIIGNLPYNISGALFEWLIENHRVIKLALITVQKEVANRIKAKPGNRDYGSLSVLIQMFYTISRLFDISPGCFSPKPKVISTVVKLVPDIKLDSDIDYNSFKRFIYDCFAQKRKTFVNSLKSSGVYPRDIIEKSLVTLGKSTDIRSEQLSGRDFLILYRKITGNA
ncbi:MAG: ribosomal RNA small subunit methyltransferase A [Candidatus Zixiibacteriota bacterium]|nr:MAG: ribosomal RNA small subunit methyltransferase A [candidate division Zixibacteria bacterium]